MGERESFRTVPSVQAGKVVDEGAFAEVRLIDYQPGNGTSYRLTFVKFDEAFTPGATGRVIERDNNTWMVTLHNIHKQADPPATAFYRHRQSVGILDVKHDLHLGPYSYNDAAVLTELIASVIGGKCPSIEDLTTRANELYRLDMANRAKE